MTKSFLRRCRRVPDSNEASWSRKSIVLVKINRVPLRMFEEFQRSDVSKTFYCLYYGSSINYPSNQTRGQSEELQYYCSPFYTVDRAAVRVIERTGLLCFV